MMKTGGFPSPIGSQARFWVQVMRDLRNGVKLKKVQERQYNPLPIEFQLTPYEMLMDDIRSKRYTLRKVLVRPPTTSPPCYNSPSAVAVIVQHAHSVVIGQTLCTCVC